MRRATAVQVGKGDSSASSGPWTAQEPKARRESAKTLAWRLKYLCRRRKDFELGKANLMTSKFSAWAASTSIGAVLIIPVAATTTAAALPWCATDSISLSTSAPGSPGSFQQIHFALILTNNSSQPCALQGYPGVDLLGPDDPKWGPDYQLPQQAGDPQLLTLAPGASASSRLTFLPEPPSGWVPHTIAVTVPNTSGRLETPWIPGDIAVSRQDAATHPGTYIGPLQLTD